MPTRPFIPVYGVFKVQLIYTYEGQRIENVLHVRSGGALLTADADRIEAVFANWWNISARPFVSGGCLLVLISLDALDSVSGLHKDYTTGWTQAGGAGAATMPGSVTSAIKLSTGLRGRSFRGRLYWPGLAPALVTGGTLTPSGQTNLAGVMNTLRTSLAAGSPSDALVVVSYRTAGLWRAAGVATDVTNASAHANIDCQRRRLPGRGL